MTRVADAFRLPFVVELQRSADLEHVDSFAAYWHVVRAFQDLLLRALEEAGVPPDKRWTLGKMLQLARERSIIPESVVSPLVQVVSHRNMLAHAPARLEPIGDFSADLAAVSELTRWYLESAAGGPHLSPNDADLVLTHIGSPVGARPRVPRSVFLCHAKEDAARVALIYERLKVRGHSPWMDKKDLLPGQIWEDEIERAIKEADFFVAVMSKHSVSKRGYVQKEVRVALDVLGEIPSGQIYLIPVQLEPCDVPPPLQRLHWIELNSEDDYTRLFESVERKRYAKQ